MVQLQILLIYPASRTLCGCAGIIFLSCKKKKSCLQQAVTTFTTSQAYIYASGENLNGGYIMLNGPDRCP
jgi:hypothetical protein